MASSTPLEAELLWQEAPCGLLMTSAEGKITRVNNTFCGWLGYGTAELEGVKIFSELLPMGARVFHQTHWSPLMQLQGSISEVQLDLLHRDGHRVPMILNAARRYVEGTFTDEIAAFVATDRKKYERELVDARGRAQQAETRLRTLNDKLEHEHRRKDEFLATLGHELRNPLAAISNVLETLKLRPSDAAVWDSTRAIFERQLGQIIHLVDDLLEASRITQGKIQLRKTKVNLVTILNAAVEAAMPAARTAGQVLRVQVPDRIMGVDGDTTRLTQIFSNLLGNAIKFTPAGGEIVLRAREEGTEIIVEVADTGQGISGGQLERIFEMFAQLNPASDKAPYGTCTGMGMGMGMGIGLALVRSLTELHGGTVQARSQGLGKGSVFEVKLPKSEIALEPAREQAPNPQAAPRRVLIVDDNIDAAETLAMLLEMMGHTVASAYNGMDGLRLMEEFKPDCALLDVGLPDINGHELARRVRVTDWGRPMTLIAATGWGQQEDKRKSLEAGFDAHLTKPITLERLIEVLAQHN